MNRPCELYKLIPEDKIENVFKTSETVGAECDFTFLGFEDVYKAVTLFVPKNRVIIDLGCAYAFQSWYFRDYRKYIGVDNGVKKNDVLETDNSEFYFMSIQEFIKEVFPQLGYRKEEIFAICSYVPDKEAGEMIREYFPYCLVYYPERSDSNNEKP